MTRTDTATRGKRPGVRPPHRGKGILIACAAFLTLQWVGCSVEKNYDTLSFFFDGVPDPNAIDLGDGEAIRKSPTFSIHEPYAEDNCLKCHPDPSELQLSMDDSSICLSCHEGVTNAYPQMHGAVVGMACLWCHNPHMSPLANLLREEAPALCIQCHDWNEPGTPIPAEHEDMERNCLECHSGHGGNDPAFLLENMLAEPLIPSDQHSESDHDP